jgi:carboxylate-amine ligase
MDSWEDYLTIVRQLQAAGFIDSPRELWWDVRPSADNGTIEVRICDMPRDLPDLLGLTALIQALVFDLSRQIKQGLEPSRYPPLMVRQNRWRACRFGLDATLVDPLTLEHQFARAEANHLAWRLRGTSTTLGGRRHLEHVHRMAARGTGADQQLAIFRETGDPAAVVRRLVASNRLFPFARPWEPSGAATMPFLPGLDESLNRSDVPIG